MFTGWISLWLNKTLQCLRIVVCGYSRAAIWSLLTRMSLQKSNTHTSGSYCMYQNSISPGEKRPHYMEIDLIFSVLGPFRTRLDLFEPPPTFYLYICSLGIITCSNIFQTLPRVKSPSNHKLFRKWKESWATKWSLCLTLPTKFRCSIV